VASAGGVAVSEAGCIIAHPPSGSSSDSKANLLDFNTACPTEFSIEIPDFLTFGNHQSQDLAVLSNAYPLFSHETFSKRRIFWTLGGALKQSITIS
jgi:hypothetical protein